MGRDNVNRETAPRAEPQPAASPPPETKPATDFDEPDASRMIELHRSVVQDLGLSPEEEEAAKAAAREIVRAAHAPGKDAEAAKKAARKAAEKARRS
jgi:hypothetical protein